VSCDLLSTDSHLVLSAGAQPRLRHQHREAGGSGGPEGGEGGWGEEEEEEEEPSLG